jgi:hypothetical protein
MKISFLPRYFIHWGFLSPFFACYLWHFCCLLIAIAFSQMRLGFLAVWLFWSLYDRVRSRILVTCTVLISHMSPLIWNLVTAPAQLLAILRMGNCWLSCACAIVGYPAPAQLLAILRNCWLSCAIVGYPAPAQLLAILRLRNCWLSCACAIVDYPAPA